MFFFFKQKTAYELRISDWSSDVCSSDLPGRIVPLTRRGGKTEGKSGAARRRIADREHHDRRQGHVLPRAYRPRQQLVACADHDVAAGIERHSGASGEGQLKRVL